MSMLHLKPLQPFAAEATGIDLREPLTPAQIKAVEEAMDQHAVLVFRDQNLSQTQQIEFAKSLGPLDMGLRKLKGGPHRLEYAELADISNVKVDGEVADRAHAKIVGNVANQLWHSDSSFQKPRAKYSMLSAVTVPKFGGETEFADLRMAWDDLPDWRQRQVEGFGRCTTHCTRGFYSATPNTPKSNAKPFHRQVGPWSKPIPAPAARYFLSASMLARSKA